MNTAAASLLDGGHRQPDRVSCGAQSVVMAAACLDPALAARLSGTPDQVRLEVLRTHRDLVTARPAGAPARLPWPRRLGTPPWAVARALTEASGVGHRVVWTPPWRRAAVVERVVRATRAGHPVPLYVGSARLPRHVVLAIPAHGYAGPGSGSGDLQVHDPATGRVAEMSAARWCSSTLTGTSWPVPWCAVLPRG